jgi:hypothetical protein
MSKPKTKARKPVERPAKVEAPATPKIMETTNYNKVEFAGSPTRNSFTLDQNIAFLAEVVEKGPSTVAEAHKIQVKSVYGRACMLRKRFRGILQVQGPDAKNLYERLLKAGVLKSGNGAQQETK